MKLYQNIDRLRIVIKKNVDFKRRNKQVRELTCLYKSYLEQKSLLLFS